MHGGPVGLNLPHCKKLYVVTLNPICIDDSYRDHLHSAANISSDQRYLRDRGEVIERLVKWSPGKLVYARYQQRLLPLNSLANFVVRVYARSWFCIKAKSLFVHGPTHIFNMITWTKSLRSEIVEDEIRKIISNNSYALHSENLLKSMLTDARQSVRRMAAERLLDARSRPTNTEKFHIACS